MTVAAYPSLSHLPTVMKTTCSCGWAKVGKMCIAICPKCGGEPDNVAVVVKKKTQNERVRG